MRPTQPGGFMEMEFGREIITEFLGSDCIIRDSVRAVDGRSAVFIHGLPALKECLRYWIMSRSSTHFA
jgi:hypothetical protein